MTPGAELAFRFGELVLRMALGLVLLVVVLAAGRALYVALAGARGAPLTVRLGATVLCAAFLLSVSFHLLAGVGHFDLPGVSVATMLAALAVTTRGGRSAAALARDAQVVGRWTRQVLPRRPLAVLLAAATVLLAVRALVSPPLAWDSLTYHLAKSGFWVQSGQAGLPAAPGGWSIYRDFPAGGEVLWAWAMVPVRGDALVGVVDVAVWLALGLAVYRVGRELGVPPESSSVAALFVLTTPAALLAAGSAYVDNLGHLFGLLAVSFALRFLRGRGAGALPLAGAAIGLAAGVKFTAVPMLALFSALAVIAVVRFRSSRLLARNALFALALAASAYAPWPARATADTGRPFSPYPVRVGPLQLGDNPELAWYLRQDVGRPYTLHDEAAAFGKALYSPLTNSLGGFAIVPLLLVPAALVAAWRRDRRAALVAGVVLADAAGFYVSPRFSVTRLGWASVSGRYFLSALALATLLGCLATTRWRRLYTGFLVAAAGFELWVYGAFGWGTLEVSRVLVQLALLAGVLALAVAALRPAPAPTLRRAALAATLVPAFLAQAALQQQTDRYAILEQGTRMHPIPRYWVNAAQLSDSPHEGYRIAVTSGPEQRGDNWFWYPFLGSRLQNTLLYVPPSRSGEVPAFSSPGFAEGFDRAAWLRRLEAARVDAVMSFGPRSPELAWMENEPARFKRADGDGSSWGLYVVRPGLPETPSSGLPPPMRPRSGT